MRSGPCRMDGCQWKEKESLGRGALWFGLYVIREVALASCPVPIQIAKRWNRAYHWTLLQAPPCAEGLSVIVCETEVPNYIIIPLVDPLLMPITTENWRGRGADLCGGAVGLFLRVSRPLLQLATIYSGNWLDRSTNNFRSPTWNGKYEFSTGTSMDVELDQTKELERDQGVSIHWT